MGLMARYRELRYRLGWRLRFWWMDTRSGARAHVTAFCISVLVLLWQMVRMANQGLNPDARLEPVHAVYWWVVQLIIAVVAAVVAYALRPKPQQQPETKMEPPSVQDGTAVKDYGGTVWIDYDENFLLDYEVVGRDPIYTKGGKK